MRKGCTQRRCRYCATTLLSDGCMEPKLQQLRAVRRSLICGKRNQHALRTHATSRNTLLPLRVPSGSLSGLSSAAPEGETWHGNDVRASGVRQLRTETTHRPWWGAGGGGHPQTLRDHLALNPATHSFLQKRTDTGGAHMVSSQDRCTPFIPLNGTPTKGTPYFRTSPKPKP